MEVSVHYEHLSPSLDELAAGEAANGAEQALATTADDGSASHGFGTLLVVEVTASAHTIDRRRKAVLYAPADIPVYWLIDISDRAVEVRTDPGPTDYSRRGTNSAW
ncbi:MAG: Uma2 family endonuclease [Solirubrobacteraceae bacterium]